MTKQNVKNFSDQLAFFAIGITCRDFGDKRPYTREKVRVFRETQRFPDHVDLVLV